MKTCSHCGSSISLAASVCPYCTRGLNQGASIGNVDSGTVPFIILFVLIFMYLKDKL